MGNTKSNLQIVVTNVYNNFYNNIIINNNAEQTESNDYNNDLIEGKYTLIEERFLQKEISYMYVCTKCNKIYDCLRNHWDCEKHLVEKNYLKAYCLTCKKVGKWDKNCEHCGKLHGNYKCDKCLFITNEEAYHCEFCNKCKSMAKDQTFHCHGCNTCLNIYFKDNHKCRERDINETCYICLELLWSTGLTVKGLPCSHNVHKKCFDKYYESLNYKGDACCGLCRKKICY